MIVHGKGRQQHSKSPQSMHLVLPGSMPAGFRMEEVEEEGRMKLSGEEVRGSEGLHIVSCGTGDLGEPRCVIGWSRGSKENGR